MKFSTFLYNFQQGLKNIWRNKMFSLASVATMAACIFLFGIFYSIVVNFQSMVDTAEESVSVTIFFVEGATDEQISSIEDVLKSSKEVSKYNFVSADEAWQEYQKEYFENNEALIESFNGDNPLADMASFEVYLKDVSTQKDFVAKMEKVDGVREVNQSEAAANVLSDFNKLLAGVSIAIIVILLAVSVFLINNTITVGISVRKEEIKIMKLIGAKDAFVRQPFIVEGMTIGLVGAAIPSVAMFFLYKSIMSYVTDKFYFLSNMLEFVPANTVFHVFIPVALILGVGIGYLGSRFTLMRHLNV